MTFCYFFYDTDQSALPMRAETSRPRAGCDDYIAFLAAMLPCDHRVAALGNASGAIRRRMRQGLKAS
jgi:hypothetical protein